MVIEYADSLGVYNRIQKEIKDDANAFEGWED